MKSLLEKKVPTEPLPPSLNLNPFYLQEDFHKEKERNKTQMNLMHKRSRYLEESVQQIIFLKAIGKALVSGLDFNNIVSALFKELKSLMGVDILSVHLQKQDTVRSRVLSAYPIDTETVERVKESAQKGYKRVSKRVHDSESLKYEFLYLPEETENDETSTSNCPFGVKNLKYPTPLLLRVRGETIGLLNLYKIKGSFSSDQIKALHMVVDQVGYVLNNSLEHMKVVELASRDGLTGILNRRVFNEILKRECQRTTRYGTPLSLILIDVDHFKAINDNYGHSIGDKVLSSLARVVDGCIRETDVFARYGGEEFAIILPETDKECAFSLAERIREAIANTSFDADTKTIGITASMGVSNFCDSENEDRNGQSPEQVVLVQADDALYKAKAEGRDKVFQAGFLE